MDWSLKNKLLFGVPLLFIVVMLVVMTAVSIVVARQNQKAANTILRNASNLIRNAIAERQKELSFDARHMSAMGDIGENIKYVTESRSYFEYSTLRPVYMKIASVIYSTSITSDIWKANIYNLNGDLMAFTIIGPSESILGCVHDRNTVEIAFLNPDEDLVHEPWIRPKGLPPGIEYCLGRVVRERESVHFEIIDNSLCLVTNVPIMGRDYDPATGKMEAKQVGMVEAVRKLDAAFVRKMSEISGTEINIFALGAMISGTFPAYETFDLSRFSDIEGGPTLGGQQLTFDDVDLTGGSYFRSVLPIYHDSKCIAAVVALYSKAIARANTAQIVGLLSLVYLVGFILIVPITIVMMVRGIINPIGRIGSMMREIAHNKDFTKMIDMESQDEIGELASSFNEMTEDLRKTTTSIDNLNREIAERKKAEEEREKLLRKVEEANQNKTQFVSNVSHELRTPMASIKGFISTIRGDPNIDPALREDFLKIIEDEADRLNRIIEDLLDLSRIESGRIKLKKENIKLTDIIKKNVGTIREQAAQKHLALKTELPEEFPCVFADSDKMSQIIINLLSNAIKYTKEGEIVISADEDDGHVRVEVSDTGIGIAPEDLPKVFEKFQRIEKPGIEAKGTGLGLSIVKALVELHDGKVFVESEPGRGSTFGFELPVIKE
jgi:signal transduction histidine kinase